MEYAQQTPDEGPSTAPPPKTLWIFPKGEKENPVQTTVVENTKAGSSGQNVAFDNPALRVALASEDAGDREETVVALGEIGGETAIRLLEQALVDQEEFVRETAAELLAQVRNQIR